MGLQPTSPPTSPLHRMPPAYHHAGLKRKHDNLEEDDLIPPNNIETPHHPEDPKKIRVEVVCGHQPQNQAISASQNNTNNLNEPETRLMPGNNNAKELETDNVHTQGEENKENQNQSPLSPGTYAARKSSPSPSFMLEGSNEKEQKQTFFASKSLSPKTNLSAKFTEDTKSVDNNDSGFKSLDNTDEDCEDDESEDDVGGATSEDDEYEEDGSEEGSEGFSSSLSPSPPHTNSAETNSVSDFRCDTDIRNCDNRHHQVNQDFHHSPSGVTSLSPKVIVEHQPLPSIYDLQQMSAACDNLDSECNFDSGLSEDDSCCGDSEDEAEGDSDSSGEDLNMMMSSTGSQQNQLTSAGTANPVVSPLFDPVLRGTSTNKSAMPPIITPSPPTPKVIYNDRFWNQGLPFNQTPPPPPSSTSLNGQQQVPQSHQPMNMLNSTFQFLEPTNQRIECAENGKSYMQLGTMSHHHSGHPSNVNNSQTNPAHHHLPVTPVIQPKPNMVYRRPIPPFRNPPNGHGPLGSHPSNISSAAMIQLQAARPVCDHTNCLQRKSSFCYRNQRSRMLNMSLHKLHMARQNHEGCLRRSVLICNMLRFIEDETEKEAIQEAHQQFPGMQNTSPPHMMETDQYWPPPQPGPAANGMQHPPITGLNGSNVNHHQPQLLPNMNGNSTLSQQGVAMPPSSPIPSSDGTTTYGIGTSPLNSGVSSYHGNGLNVQNSTLPSNMTTGNSNTNQQPLLNHPAIPATGAPSTQSLNDSYEVALKDFNTAFRSTPYSSPVHHPGSLADIESNGVNNESLGLSSSVSQPLSSSCLSSTGSNSLDDCKGSTSGTINWGSVLSLGSQSDLDPLNNNSFAVETWPSTTVSGVSIASSSSTTTTPTTGASVLPSTIGPGVSCQNTNMQNGMTLPTPTSMTSLTSLPPLNLSDLDIPGQNFGDDIGWKLSADDVLKAFPSDEQIFVGS